MENLIIILCLCGIILVLSTINGTLEEIREQIRDRQVRERLREQIRDSVGKND